MTKKDFEAIAQAIKDAREASGPVPVANTVPANEYFRNARIFDSLSRSVADVLALQNPRFKRLTFLKDCGVDTLNQPLHRNR